ncbi:superoxide dismutase [Persicobacter psychrovividus]|uniref:Superoxide dismutase n=1 Tax=Persicobacter psychrovividus TaxID=387638 RepID=A0ABM7VAT9_9BACT|nr:superoxide dismutase [Persicobacter psychrovividus]
MNKKQNLPKTNSRRAFVKNATKAAILSAAGLSVIGTMSACEEKSKEESSATSENKQVKPTVFTQAALPYEFAALEPHIDAQTMEIHYGKHHAGYVRKLNAAVEKEGVSDDLNTIFQHISKYNTAIRNNGGGHYNHTLFWEGMTPAGEGKPTGALAKAINKDFGSFEDFKTKFSAAASGRFGSGWAWLVITADKKLAIGSTPNQDNPLMADAEIKGTPLLNLDVWEHAYYLKYQNMRADYISSWWNLVNWEEVARRFES